MKSLGKLFMFLLVMLCIVALSIAQEEESGTAYVYFSGEAEGIVYMHPGEYIYSYELGGLAKYKTFPTEADLIGTDAERLFSDTEDLSVVWQILQQNFLELFEAGLITDTQVEFYEIPAGSITLAVYMTYAAEEGTEPIAVTPITVELEAGDIAFVHFEEEETTVTKYSDILAEAEAKQGQPMYIWRNRWPDSPSLDIFVNDELVETEFSYGDTTYLVLPYGDVSIKLSNNSGTNTLTYQSVPYVGHALTFVEVGFVEIGGGGCCIYYMSQSNGRLKSPLSAKDWLQAQAENTGYEVSALYAALEEYNLFDELENLEQYSLLVPTNEVFEAAASLTHEEMEIFLRYHILIERFDPKFISGDVELENLAGLPLGYSRSQNKFNFVPGQDFIQLNPFNTVFTNDGVAINLLYVDLTLPE